MAIPVAKPLTVKEFNMTRLSEIRVLVVPVPATRLFWLIQRMLRFGGYIGVGSIALVPLSCELVEIRHRFFLRLRDFQTFVESFISPLLALAFTVSVSVFQSIR
jgi:hypothetical protein